MNPVYHVIILDDEPPARELMQVFVSRMPDLQCVATCSNAIQGLHAIQEHKPDLLLLDIRMPEMTGFDLMGLPLLHRPDIILTTAYPDYALNSYEFSVLDYLVKPIPFDRFTKSILKFRQKREAQGFTSPDAQTMSTQKRLEVMGFSPSDSPDERSVWLREDKRLLQIPYDSVYYIEGSRDYVKVFLADEMIMTHMGIGQAEKLFLPPQFVRIHRSFIVRRSAIRFIEGNSVFLINGKELALGPNYREELRKYILALPKL